MSAWEENDDGYYITEGEGSGLRIPTFGDIFSIKNAVKVLFGLNYSKSNIARRLEISHEEVKRYIEEE